MARANKGMGGGAAGNRAGPDGHQSPGKPGETSETDLASDKMGDFGQQGHDQNALSNERDAVPDVRQEADGVIESFEKLDKETRAKRDLGKGRRHAPEHPYNRGRNRTRRLRGEKQGG